MSPRAWIAGSLLLVASCSGSLFQSKAEPPTVYVLRPAQTAPESALAAELIIDRPQLRPGLDGSSIAIEFADRRLDHYANAAWSGDVGDLLLDFAVHSFRQSSGLVSVAAESTRFAASYRLEMTVNDFVARYQADRSAPVIVVDIAARLGRDGRPMPGGEMTAHIERPAASNRLGAVVEAYEEASQGAIAELIAATRRAIAASSAP